MLHSKRKLTESAEIAFSNTFMGRIVLRINEAKGGKRKEIKRKHVLGYFKVGVILNI